MHKLLLVLILVSLPACLCAETSDRLIFFGSLEYLTLSGADKPWKDEYEEAAASSAATDPSYSNSACLGARLGVLKQMGDWEFGMSLGRIKGPSADFKIPFYAIYSPIIYSYEMNGEMESYFWRIMPEIRRQFPIGKNLYLEISGGLGIAFGELKETIGIVVTSPTQLQDSSTIETSWNGLSYEISPKIKFQGKKYYMAFGLRFLHFPALDKQRNWWSENFSWNPLSLFIEAGF